MDAALSGLTGSEARVLEQLLQADATRRRSGRQPSHAGGDDRVRGAQEPPLQRCSIRSRQATHARRGSGRRCLHGAEVALLGPPPPGSPARREPRAATDRARPVPAHEADPAGPRRLHDLGSAETGPMRRPGRAAGRGRGAARPTLALAREPALAAVASNQSDPLASRAAAVLARVGWPGKAGETDSDVAPLSPAEQARFTAGREVYQNLCAACHQANGRGLETGSRRRSSDRSSRWRSPGVPIRILLNGKEGPGRSDAAARLHADRRADRRRADLHPPRMGPDRIARRSATVAADASGHRGRTRPWTNDELARSTGGQ